MKKGIVVLVTVLLVVLASSCSGGLDYMIEEYNSRFGIHDDLILFPGDMGYNQGDMILPEYHVDVDNSLNIPAPTVKDATYQWQISKDGEEITNFITRENGMDTRVFHLLEGNLPIGTYTLRLTLKVAGQVLTDEAIVTVHDENSGYGDTNSN